MERYEISEETRRTRPTAVREATMTVAEIPDWLGATYHAVVVRLAAEGTGPAGPPFARYRPLGEGRHAVEAGFPVATPIGGDGEVHPSSLPGGSAAATIHLGGYEDLGAAYEALATWVADHGGEPSGAPWEVYLSDPQAQPDPATWRTEVVQPFRRT